MPDDRTKAGQRRSGRPEDENTETIHDEHPVEPAEGARRPGEDAQPDVREHPSDPAEGRRDIGR
jgi:hypothetical protein